VEISAPEELAVWKAAAAARHYSYQSHILGPGLSGQMFKTGERVVATSLINALQAPSPFLAGSVNGRYLDSDFSPHTISASFVAIPLARPVPNVVLLTSGLDVLRHTGVETAGHVPLSVDGDFSKPFEILSAPGFELDARQILTPELIALALDVTGGCDIELVDEWMFVYSAAGKNSTEEALEGIEKITRHVQARVAGQSEFVQTDADDVVVAEPAPSVPRVTEREEREARAGAVATGRRALDSQMHYTQRLVLFSLGSFITGGLAWWFVSDLLPNL
jgi:hypothetical protein